MIIPQRFFLFVIKARVQAIHDFMQKNDRNPVLTLIRACGRLNILLQEIQGYIEKHKAPKEKELITEGMNLDDETIPRTKAWIVTEEAIVAFTCNGKFHVLVDGKPLVEGKYLGKKRDEETTWFNWLSKRHEEEISG